MFLQKVIGEHGGLGIGIVAADRVQDMNIVLDELQRGNFHGRVALENKATLQAVIGIRQLV